MSTESWEAFAFVILEAMEILTKAVDNRRRRNARPLLVARELNADRDSTQSNAFARLASMEILTSLASTSMSVRLKFVERTPSASTPQEVMTANASKITLEIHSKCVPQFRKDFATILRLASAAKKSHVHRDSIANAETVRICARKSSAVLDQLAMLESVSVLQATVEMRTI